MVKIKITKRTDEEYTVEGIAGIKYDFHNGRTLFLVKWKDYEEATWEPFSNLEGLALLTPKWTDLAEELSNGFVPFSSQGPTNGHAMPNKSKRVKKT